jgi:hypothetical protein
MLATTMTSSGRIDLALWDVKFRQAHFESSRRLYVESTSEAYA